MPPSSVSLLSCYFLLSNKITNQIEWHKEALFKGDMALSSNLATKPPDKKNILMNFTH